MTNGITASMMMARRAPSPSSPAPTARRFAASGLDRSVRPSKIVRQCRRRFLDPGKPDSPFTEIPYTKFLTFPMTPLFPRSGPSESSSPTSTVILRCYDFPARIPGHLLVSLPGSTLPSLGSCLVACAHAPGRTEGIFRARVIVQPATHLPTCSHVDVGGISQVPRRSILCLCLVPGPRPNRRSLAY